VEQIKPSLGLIGSKLFWHPHYTCSIVEGAVRMFGPEKCRQLVGGRKMCLRGQGLPRGHEEHDGLYRQRAGWYSILPPIRKKVHFLFEN
jgi:hypothetical protein